MAAKTVKLSDLRTWGRRFLSLTESPGRVIAGMKEKLASYEFDEQFEEDIYAWLTCILAIRAASLGNFGVGSVVINSNGDMVAWGHNQVFKPFFASDLHAEMAAMDRFEKENKGLARVKKYQLFTSIESCPMCLLRLINSGIGTVVHVASDVEGGMQHRMDDLPPAWLKLAGKQTFRPTECSAQLVDYAGQIFQSNLAALYRQIEQR